MPDTKRPLIHLRISFFGAVENIQRITDSITRLYELENVEWRTTSETGLIHLDTSIKVQVTENSAINNFTAKLGKYFTQRASLSKSEHANTIGFHNVPLEQLPRTGVIWQGIVKPHRLMMDITDQDGVKRDHTIVVISNDAANKCHLT